MAVVAAMLAAAGIAYMASGGVASSSAGEGSGTVTVTTAANTVSTPTMIRIP